MHDTDYRWFDCGANDFLSRSDKIVHDDHWLRPQFRVHMCGRTIGAPSRRPTAMRMVALSNLSPILDSGEVWRHRILVHVKSSTWSVAASSSWSAWTSQHRLSHTPWTAEAGGDGAIKVVDRLVAYWDHCIHGCSDTTIDNITQSRR